MKRFGERVTSLSTDTKSRCVVDRLNQTHRPALDICNVVQRSYSLSMDKTFVSPILTSSIIVSETDPICFINLSCETERI